MYFPPINLWSKPYQQEYDRLKDDLDYHMFEKHITDSLVEIKLKRVKELEFLYYLRSGRFPE